MNSFEGKEWELYDYHNIGGSTEYDNLLINKDIDNYFNDIINKPVIQTNSNPIKLGGGFNKFYSDYIEHNLIFIVVLIGIVIFLIIRYYVKDFDNIDSSNHNDKMETNKMSKHIKENEKIKNKNKKLEIEKIKLINYKKELDMEKQQILSIIDELSNLNELESKKNEQMYLNQDINAIYSNNLNNLNNLNNSNYFNQQQHFETNTRAVNDDDIITNGNYPKNNNLETNYYDFNKVKNDKTNEIDGLYIEPPFM